MRIVASVCKYYPEYIAKFYILRSPRKKKKKYFAGAAAAKKIVRTPEALLEMSI